MRARLVLTGYALVVLTTAHIGAYSIRTTEDASIGGGGLWLLVVTLGLPWSTFYFFIDTETASAWLATVLAACAIFNGGLAYFLLGYGRRGRGDRT